MPGVIIGMLKDKRDVKYFSIKKEKGKPLSIVIYNGKIN